MCPATRRPGVQPGLVHEPCSISLMLFWLVLTNARACNLKARLYVRFLAIFPRSSSSLLFLFEVSTPQVQDQLIQGAVCICLKLLMLMVAGLRLCQIRTPQRTD